MSIEYGMVWYGAVRLLNPSAPVGEGTLGRLCAEAESLTPLQAGFDCWCMALLAAPVGSHDGSDNVSQHLSTADLSINIALS
jgi:hypothetical protein